MSLGAMLDRQLAPVQQAIQKFSAMQADLVAKTVAPLHEMMTRTFEANGRAIRQALEQGGQIECCKKIRRFVDILMEDLGEETDDLFTALDLIFEHRYGWAHGTAEHLTIPEIFIALEHALEYDAPGKPSVWEIS